MKKKLIAWGVVAVIVLGFFGLTKLLSGSEEVSFGIRDGTVAFSEPDVDITEDVLNGAEPFVAGENDRFVLTADHTASPVLRSKTTGKVWYGVPQTQFGNAKYNSAVAISYFSNNSTEVTLYSSESCIDKGQVRVSAVSNGFSVEYGFGEMAESYLYPEMISKERLQSFLDKMEEEDAEYVLRRYTYYDLKKMEDNEQKKYIVNEFPQLKKQPLYILGDMSSKSIMRRTSRLFADAGYTLADKEKDSGLGTSEKPQSVVIAVDYLLTENGLSVSVDTSRCRFYTDYPLKSINILPYFDGIADGTPGHLVLPLGSGATVRVAAGEPETERAFPIYGENTALGKNVPDYSSQFMLPVFGQYAGNSGYLCIVGDGAEQAKVRMDRNAICTGISPDFTVIDSGTYKMGAQNPVELFADKVAAKRFSAEYVLLEGLTDGNGYSEMARLTRERLKNEKMLGTGASDGLPFVAEVVGGLNYDDMALGCIPTNREFTLTDFETSGKIAEEIAGYTGAENLNLLLTGWNKKGINRQKLGAVSVSKRAGGRTGLSDLWKSLDKSGIRSYLDLNFVLTETFKNDGFSLSDDAARTINNNIVTLQQLDALKYTLQPTALRLVSPAKYEGIWQNYRGNKTISGFGLGVSQLTSVLAGDYADGKEIYRAKTLKSVQKILGEAERDGHRLTGDAGNLYAVKYLDLITNLPMNASGESFIEYEIPFLQMVLHGTVDYVSEPLNGYADGRETLLRLIETGSGIHYRITANRFDGLFDTDASYLYNTNYVAQKDQMRRYYSEAGKVLSGLSGIPIKEHCHLTGDVVCVTYENGTKLYINYGGNRYANSNISVDAFGYLRMD